MMSTNEVATITSLDRQIFADALRIIQKPSEIKSMTKSDDAVAKAIKLLEKFGKTLAEFKMRVTEEVRAEIQKIACRVNPHLSKRRVVEQSVFSFLRQLLGTLKNYQRAVGVPRQHMIDFFYAAARPVF